MAKTVVEGILSDSGAFAQNGKCKQNGVFGDNMIYAA